MNTHTTYSAQCTVQCHFGTALLVHFAFGLYWLSYVSEQVRIKQVFPEPNGDKRADDIASAETMSPADRTVLRVSSPAGWRLQRDAEKCLMKTVQN